MLERKADLHFFILCKLFVSPYDVSERVGRAGQLVQGIGDSLQTLVHVLIRKGVAQNLAHRLVLLTKPREVAQIF